MSREITKRFAAIGDELSPPKPKAALVVDAKPQKMETAFVAARRNDKKLTTQEIFDEMAEREERADYIRERTIYDLGPGIPSDVMEGIVQAQLEFEDARRFGDNKKASWWRQRLDYIREQARKQSRGMLASPLGVPMTPSLIESFKTMDWAQQQEIAKVTGIKQEMDYLNDCLVVRTQYVDGKVSMERIDRRSMEDNSRFAACNKCGQPRFYPDGKTYHLCPATTKSYRIPPGGGVTIK